MRRYNDAMDGIVITPFWYTNFIQIETCISNGIYLFWIVSDYTGKRESLVHTFFCLKEKEICTTGQIYMYTHRVVYWLFRMINVVVEFVCKINRPVYLHIAGIVHRAVARRFEPVNTI